MSKKQRARVIGYGRRSLTGLVAIEGQTQEPFESSLERDLLQLLDFNQDKKQVTAQPLTLTYQDAGGVLRPYTPDILVEFEDSQNYLIEVKFRETLKQDWPSLRPKFKAAIRHCKQRNWRFKIMTEVEIRGGALLKNVKFLRGYRQWVEDEDIEFQLLRMLDVLGESTPRKLLNATFASEENQLKSLGYLWRLIAARRVLTSLHCPLTMNSPIWINSEEKCQNHHLYRSHLVLSF